jgi:hypothetical protein
MDRKIKIVVLALIGFAMSFPVYGDTVLFSSRGFEGDAYAFANLNTYALHGKDGWVTDNSNIIADWRYNPNNPGVVDYLLWDRVIRPWATVTTPSFACRAVSGANRNSVIRTSWTWHTGKTSLSTSNYITVYGGTGDPEATSGFLYPGNWSVSLYGNDWGYSVIRNNDVWQNITPSGITASSDIQVEVLADYAINSMVITVKSGASTWTSTASRIDIRAAAGQPAPAMTGVCASFTADTTRETSVDNMKVESVSSELTTFTDNFESYNTLDGNDIAFQSKGLYSIGQVWDPCVGYVDKGRVFQNLGDGVNTTKVLRHLKTTSGKIAITPVALGAFEERSGKLRLTVDIKPISGNNGIFLSNDYFDAEGCVVWFNADYSFGVPNYSLFYSSQWVPGKWYRVTIDATIDRLNGSNSTFDVSIYNLTDSTDIGTEFGFPCLGDFRWASQTEVLSQHESAFEAYFDNWSVVPIIENCTDVQDQGYGIAADVNRDCYVTLSDLAFFASQWLQSNNPM